MRRIPEATLRRMALGLSVEDRDEMAIPSYLHRNPALRWMAWRRVEVVARRLARVMRDRPRAAASITDFGCGTGVLFGEATRWADSLVGIDLQLGPARLLAAEQRLDVTLLTPAEAEARLAPASQDVVIAAEVLEHVDDVAATLQFFGRILKPGGRLLVSLPTENALYRFGRRLAGFHGEYHHQNAASVHAVALREGWAPGWRATIPLPGPLAIYWVIDYGRT